MGPQAQLLPCGKRLHLQHGPIDLIIGADGARDVAFKAARSRFEDLLQELVTELPALRRQDAPRPKGATAQQMYDAVQPHAGFVTPMAAVAGSVADTILEAMLAAAPLSRAYVNNGGDIALHLGDGASFVTSIRHHNGGEVGRITLDCHSGIGGIATSGRHGRSLSMGIADSVTVLAQNAAQADAAATLIANAVDLPGHPAILKRPAHDLDPDSDLGARLVVTNCKPLSNADVARAMRTGLTRAKAMRRAGLIAAAAISLQDQTECLGPHLAPHLATTQRSILHA